MNSADAICDHCRASTPLVFCACTSPETLLCGLCTNKHIINNPRGNHFAKPLDQLPYYKISGYYERLQIREETFPNVKEQALKSVLVIDKAIKEYSAEVEKLILELVDCSQKVIGELKETQIQLRDDIQTGLNEVELTLKEDNPTLNSKYGPVFRDMAQTQQFAQLFHYKLNISQTSLQTLVSLEIQLPHPHDLILPVRFAGVYENKAFVYDAGSQAVTSTTLSVNFGTSGSYVELDRDTLLCVGACPASSATYLLDLSSFLLSPLPSLSTPRRDAGIAKVNTRIYVFGGADASDTPQRSCEKMDLSNKQWTDIGSMNHARGGFLPCHFRSLLYLVSSWECSNRSVETFNPESETFTVLSLSLPPQLILGKASIAFAFNNKLCVLTGRKQMLRWEVDTEREFRLSKTGQIMWSYQQPLIVGSVLLIACSGGVVQFSLETFSYIKRVI